MYIFGGISQLNPVNDLYSINLETYECKAIEKKGYWPSPISSHTAVINIETKKIYVYGGFIKYNATSDVYEYNIATNEWVKLSITEPIPPPRSSHACAYSNAESMIIYGGLGKDGDLLNDLWILDIAELKWKLVDFSSSPVLPAVKYVNYISHAKVTPW